MLYGNSYLKSKLHVNTMITIIRLRLDELPKGRLATLGSTKHAPLKLDCFSVSESVLESLSKGSIPRPDSDCDTDSFVMY